MSLFRVTVFATLCAGGCSPAWAQSADGAPAQAPEPAPAESVIEADSSRTVEPPPSPPVPPRAAGFSYQVGMAGVWRPTYAGSDRLEFVARPVLSLQWGRLRMSSSKAGLIEHTQDGGVVGGASYALVESARWNSGVALRADGGRSSSDDPRLAGVPGFKPTLRARAYASYILEGPASDVRSIGLSVSTDVLNRRGGTTLGLDVSRRVQLAPDLRWTHGLGLGAADRVYMRSNYGVTPSASAASGLPVFEPGAGLTDVHLSTGLVWRMHKRWRVGGTVNASQALGAAASSPLTQQRLSYGLVLGLVYISGQD